MLVWEDGYKIGNGEMDAQHLILFALLNQLDVNINADKADECVGDILSALGGYITYHFAHEEKLMETVGYPGVAEHKLKHIEFVAEIARLRENSGGDQLKAALKIRGFVLEWLLGHILEVDAEYAQYIADKA